MDIKIFLKGTIMKKLLYLLLCLLTVLLVTACGSGDITKTDNTDVTAKDLTDKKFIFGTIHLTEYFQEEAFSQSGDRLLERYRAIENEFNCEFEVIGLPGDAMPAIRSAQAVGLDVPDVVDVGGDVGYSLYQVNGVQAFDDIPGIDINDEDKWGSKNFIVNANHGGKQYGIFANRWETIPQMGGLLLFNNILINEWVLPNPYELYENKQWTWDTFKEILIQARHDEDKTKYYGLVIHDDWGDYGFIFMKTAIFSNGGRALVEKNGKLAFGYDSAESMEAMEWAGSLLADDLAKRTRNPEMEEFTQGQSVFFLGDSWTGTVHTSSTPYLPSEQMKEYGFMHFPSGPKVPVGTTASYVALIRRLMFLPTLTDNKPEDLGLVLNFMFDVLDYETKVTWKDVLRREVVHHKEDAEVFMKMYEDVVYDQSAYYYDNNEAVNKAFLSVYNKKGAGIVEAMQKISEVITNDVHKNLYGE